MKSMSKNENEEEEFTYFNSNLDLVSEIEQQLQHQRRQRERETTIEEVEDRKIEHFSSSILPQSSTARTTPSLTSRSLSRSSSTSSLRTIKMIISEEVPNLQQHQQDQHRQQSIENNCSDEAIEIISSSINCNEKAIENTNDLNDFHDDNDDQKCSKINDQNHPLNNRQQHQQQHQKTLKKSEERVKKRKNLRRVDSIRSRSASTSSSSQSLSKQRAHNHHHHHHRHHHQFHRKKIKKNRSIFHSTLLVLANHFQNVFVKSNRAGIDGEKDFSCGKTEANNDECGVNDDSDRDDIIKERHRQNQWLQKYREKRRKNRSKEKKHLRFNHKHRGRHRHRHRDEKEMQDLYFLDPTIVRNTAIISSTSADNTLQASSKEESISRDPSGALKWEKLSPNEFETLQEYIKCE